MLPLGPFISGRREGGAMPWVAMGGGGGPC